MDVLYACTDQSQIALEVIRVNEALDLNTEAKMYTMALEVRVEPRIPLYCCWRSVSLPKFGDEQTKGGHPTCSVCTRHTRLGSVKTTPRAACPRALRASRVGIVQLRLYVGVRRIT